MKWDGVYVAGISRVTGLIRTTEVVAHREGGDPNASRKAPGLTQFEPVTLERGLTHDSAFEDRANQVWHPGAGLGSEASLNEFRKDIVIELYNEAGQLVLSYKVQRCRPSGYQALPSLDSDTTAVAIERIKIENEGFERDKSVHEPART